MFLIQRMLSVWRDWRWLCTPWSNNKPAEYHCYKDLDYTKPPPDGTQSISTLEDLVPHLTTPHTLEGYHKRCLDLYLPGPKANSSRVAAAGGTPPLVVFVHGGGWRRGDRQAWRHFLSDQDTNFCVALIFRFLGLYGNIGKTMAGAGVACAVVSYPLSRLPFPRCLTEHLISFCLSLIPTWILLRLILSLTTGVLFYHTHSYENFKCDSVLFSSPGKVTFIVSLFIRWYIMFRTQILKQVLTIRTAICIVVGAIAAMLSCPYIIVYWSDNTQTSSTSGTSTDNYLRHTVCSIISISVPTLLVELYFTWRFLHTDSATHPAHVQAVASSVAWLLQVGQAAPGTFDMSGVTLIGHSAGGHLVSLLTVNQRYLREVGVDRRVVKRVLAVSGVYDLEWMSSPPLDRYYLIPAFGPRPRTWRQASPLSLLRGEEKEDNPDDNSPFPPFLVCSAACELPGLVEQADDFCRELLDKGAWAEHHVIANSSHFSVIANFKPDGQLGKICIEFVRRRSMRREYPKAT